jgi:hypothetical protein
MVPEVSILLKIEKITKHSVIPAKAGIQSKTLWIPAQGRNDKHRLMLGLLSLLFKEQ